MPAKKKAAAAEEVDYTKYADKEPTDLQSRMAAWVLDVTGYDPAKAKTKADAYNEGVRLGVALRMQFQASPENQELLGERKAAAAAAKAERASKPAAKRGRKPKPAEPEELEPEELDEDDVEEEEEPAPKTRRRAAPAKATTRRRAASKSDAPF